MLNTIEAIERVTVTIRLGSRVGAGLLLSSLQRVELHRHRVWRYNTLYPSGHALQCHSVTCYSVTCYSVTLTTMSLFSDL